MSAMAWPVSKSPVSPFMKSTNSEYGNWFQRTPPSPFTFSSSLPHTFSGGKKVAFRRFPSYSPGGQATFPGEDLRSRATNNTEVIVNQAIPLPVSEYRPVRPAGFSYARSLSYTSDTSPREGSTLPGGATHTQSDTSHDTGRIPQRSHTAVETERVNERLNGISLRRSRTFTEGAPSWRTAHRDTSVITDTMALEAPPTYNRTHITPHNALPSVPDLRKPSEVMSHVQLRSPIYLSYNSRDKLLNLNEDLKPESPLSSVNPYSTDMPVKTYHGLMSETFRYPDDTSLERISLERPNSGKVEVMGPQISPRVTPQFEGPRMVKSVKSILKKRSAYEGGGYRSEDHQGWGTYSGLSYSVSLRRPQSGYHNAPLPDLKKRSAGKKVTFSV